MRHPACMDERMRQIMKISQLLQDSGYTYTGVDAEIIGVTDDTRQAGEGFVYAGIKGERFDGEAHAAEMLEKGAAAVIVSHDMGLGDRQIIADDTRIAYGKMVSAFAGHPEKKLRLIGITGTNGKTTTATLIHHILMETGHKCGFIGTTAVLSGTEPVDRDENTPTTPAVKELYSIFNKMVDDGCEFCVMEVSSFGLCQNRIGPAVFEVSVFTNLTQDHLDYHGTMENYFEAKKLLFTRHSGFAFINADDGYGRMLLDDKEVCSHELFGSGAGGDGYRFDNARFENGATSFEIHHGTATEHYRLPMIGEYNVSNACAAIAVCSHLGLSADEIRKAVEDFSGVRGRCEIIPSDNDFTVICDYAHSPDALENMLSNIKKVMPEGRLVCLFGCGGDRDRTKRPKMAAAVAKYADRIIVTSDNPRNEDPGLIIDDIIPGFPENTVYERVTDRKEAIFHAVLTARKGDMIVLAGKGHEDYQILPGNVHIHFDEREITAEAFSHLKETMTIGEIAKAVDAENIGADEFIRVAAKNISSDTRTIKQGDLFIAIKGENFDGADYAQKAMELGAVAVISERAVEGVPTLKVASTRKALLDLAGFYRSRFDIPVVGITGSVGKTTTKEMTAIALGSKYNVLRTEGNHNNEIGMPFTLFSLTTDHTAAVIEMGMSHFDEIDRMTHASKPDICIITNIGWSHVENLGSREGIRKAKLEILHGAPENAPLIVGADDMLLPLRDELSRPVIVCDALGLDTVNGDYTAKNIAPAADHCEFDIVNKGTVLGRVSLACTGMHHILDALIAVAAAVAAGCDPGEAIKALEGYAPAGLRQHIEKVNGISYIIDCYNAAPASMRAALGVLGHADGRRIAVLGDMLELGDYAPQLHHEVGESAEEIADILVTVGENAKYINEGFGHPESPERSYHFDNNEQAADLLRTIFREGDTVLVKASRGMKFEQIYKALTE